MPVWAIPVYFVHSRYCPSKTTVLQPFVLTYFNFQELFNQFQSSNESALPPDSLRFALAEAFSDQRRFQMGFMDDAAECFVSCLDRFFYPIN